MSIERDYNTILKTVSTYRKKLASFSEDQWQLTPPIGGWSYSEVYFHIFDASILTLETLADAAKGNGKEKRTSFIAKVILFFAGLPPGKKFQAPQRLTERLKKISREEAVALIDQFVAQLDAEMPKIKTASRFLKTRHPKLGYFNAFQWLRFTHIHLSHHLKQLDRIEKSF
ncbi:MAG: DinB family protein [Bacteroidota bacterium]